MTDPVDVKLIEEWLEADGKRTQGLWVYEKETPRTISFSACMSADYGHIVAIPQGGGDSSLRNANAAFIAASSRIGPVIRALLAERKARESEREGLRAALALYESVYPHSAPHDCFATGPRTGDALMDLVACPGCECQRRAREALAGAGK